VKTINVNLTPAYRVLVGDGILSEAGARIREALPALTRAVIVTDTRIHKLWAARLARSLRAAKIRFSVVEVPRGERAKTLAVVAGLMERFAAEKLDRKSAVLALGGGAVGDVAGFAASIYMRGIPVVQLPTTLLAQVDASIGGKTGVDLRSGKNLVGTFHQPSLVISDTATLTSLPEREFRAGLFEVIKCGVIRDEKLFELLRDRQATVLSRDPEMLERIIVAAATIKAEVVAADEREAGLRRILNFGHTIGHAIEASGRYRRYMHGEAVGWGMMAAAEIGCEAGITPREVADGIREVVESYGPLSRVRASAAELVAYVGMDKKTVGGVPHFVLPTRLGEVTISGKITREQMRRGIERIL